MNGEWVIFILVVGVEVCVEPLNLIGSLFVPRLLLTNFDDVTLRGTDRSAGSGTYASATLFITNSIRTAPKNTPDLRSERNSDRPPTLHYGDSFFLPMPPHVLMNFRGFPPACGDSVADF